ncbi:MAG: spondin domain-containing protein [Pyrinomonadaceae bacterium]
MRKKKISSGLAVTLFAVIVGAQGAAVSASGKAKGKAKETRFRVRIENISNAEGQTAADGTKWPFALSPGMYVIDDKAVTLFKAGKKAPANGLEAQAEDGNPSELVKALEAHHSPELRGVFNTPAGAEGPGPIGPGAAYEFTFTAAPKMKLSLVTMFGQSNDLFYAPDKPIELFDRKGNPVSGDITAKLTLWDAGTEADEEPGVGQNQAPRQKAPNTGAAENGVVRRAQ